MKCFVKIALTGLCLTLAGCGLTNPYEKWLDEGLDSPDRLLPSKLKETLCETGTWKVTYNNRTVYYQFGNDWSVTSDSDKIKPASDANYIIRSESSDALSLTINGGGHLSYFVPNPDEVFVVSAFSTSSITATGKTSGITYTFSPSSSAELEAMAEAKAVLVDKMTAVFQKYLSAGFASAVVRNASGEFKARISFDPKEFLIKFDVITDKVLSHPSSEVTVDASDNFVLVESLTIGGETVTGITLEDGEVTLNGVSGLTVSKNTEGRELYLRSDYTTHAINVREGRGDADQAIVDELRPHDGWGAIEFNDRSTRPLVFCPDNVQDHYWYTFFDSFTEADGPVVSKDYDDIIFMQNKGGYMPFGTYGPDCAAEIWEDLPIFMNAYFHKDGLFVVHETDGTNSYLWFVSPTTEHWIKARD